VVCPAWRWVELDVVAAYLIELAGPAGVEGAVATAQQIDPSVRHRELFDLKRGNTCRRQRNQALTGHSQLRRSFFGRPERQLTAARSVIPATTRGGRAVRPVSLASCTLPTLPAEGPNPLGLDHSCGCLWRHSAYNEGSLSHYSAYNEGYLRCAEDFEGHQAGSSSPRASCARPSLSAGRWRASRSSR
jgi:hypothetical protein